LCDHVFLKPHCERVTPPLWNSKHSARQHLSRFGPVQIGVATRGFDTNWSLTPDDEMRASLQHPRTRTPGHLVTVLVTKETKLWLWYARLWRAIRKVYGHHKCGRDHLESQNHCFACPKHRKPRVSSCRPVREMSSRLACTPIVDRPAPIVASKRDLLLDASHQILRQDVVRTQQLCPGPAKTYRIADERTSKRDQINLSTLNQLLRFAHSILLVNHQSSPTPRTLHQWPKLI
jgi:hypothetical protein